MTWPSVLIATLLCCRLCPAADLSQLRDVYETHLQKIRDNCTAATERWAGSYRRALEVQRSAAQAAGDLEGLTGANAEIKRFQADGSLTRQHVVTQSAGLRVLQENALKELGTYPLERDRAIMELLDLYVARLEAEKKRLTQAGDLTRALDMNAEIKRVESSPAVADAKFNLALQLSTTPTREPETPGTKPGETPTQPLKPQRTTYGTVYPRGLRPDSSSDVPLRRQTVYTTDNCPLSRSVSLTLLAANVRGSGSRYRTDGREYYHRLEVRAGNTEETLSDVTVCIDYFSKQRKTGYSSTGKLAPRKEETHTFPLGSLTGETTTIDARCVPASSSTSYIGSSSSWYGRDYYGVIISVFSDKGLLLYQVGSASGLKTLGRVSL